MLRRGTFFQNAGKIQNAGKRLMSNSAGESDSHRVLHSGLFVPTFILTWLLGIPSLVSSITEKNRSEARLNDAQTTKLQPLVAKV